MATHQAVFGVYRTRWQAEKAIEALRRAGIPSSHIMMLSPPKKNAVAEDLYLNKTMIGVGAVVGGSLGLFIGASIGAILGAEIFSSTTWGVLLGAISGIIIGGGAGALVGIGTPQPLPYRYLEYVKEGGVVLAVDEESEPEVERVEKIMEETGADEVAEGDKDRMTDAFANRL